MVIGDPGLLGHHRRFSGGLLAVVGGRRRGDGRGRGRRGVLQQHRDRDQRDQKSQRREQQAAIAHVAIEVLQEAGCAHVLHGEVDEVGVDDAEVEPVLDAGVAVAGVEVAGAGPLGVAPAVVPWAAGVR